MQLEFSAMHGDQPLDNGQAETGTLFGALDRDRALTEGREDDGDFVFRKPGPLSRIEIYWPPPAVQPTRTRISPPVEVNFTAFDRRLRAI